MDKTAVIIQSGAMGDIFVVAPIANYYKRLGYHVAWPVRGQFFNLVDKYFPYVQAVNISSDFNFKEADKDWLKSDTINLISYYQGNGFKASENESIILDIADRGKYPLQAVDETFEEYKYRAAGVPFAFKNHLAWIRDKEKEIHVKNSISKFHKIDLDKDEYVVAHVESSHGDRAVVPDSETRKIIYITPMPGYEIPDWYLVIKNAKAIYAVESSVQQFIDGAIHRLKYQDEDKKFYILSRSSLSPGESYTVASNWDKKYMT